MNNKILVAYASRAGSTVGVAEAIGKTLVEHGAQVDVLPVQEVIDLAPYRAVVAGSAIQGKQWLPEADAVHADAPRRINQTPFAAFLVCMTLTIGNGKYRPEVANWLQPVRSLAKPVSEGLFAGVLDISKVPKFGDRCEVPPERRLWRLVGGRSPGLECHPPLGGEPGSAVD